MSDPVCLIVAKVDVCSVGALTSYFSFNLCETSHNHPFNEIESHSWADPLPGMNTMVDPDRVFNSGYWTANLSRQNELE